MKNKIDLCIKCSERAVDIKKDSLCMRCYQQERLSTIRVGKISEITLRKYECSAEVLFVRNYFTHKNWIHLPATFKFEGISYAPDFYDREKNVFIEVIGTRSAYHQNKEKYKMFRSNFPKIILEIRCVDGFEITQEVENEDIISWEDHLK